MLFLLFGQFFGLCCGMPVWAEENCVPVVRVLADGSLVESIILSKISKEYAMPIGYQDQTQSSTREQWGTGFCVAENVVVTAFHVVGLSSAVGVEWQGEMYPVEVLRAIPELDLLWLHILSAVPISCAYESFDILDTNPNVYVLGFATKHALDRVDAKMVEREKLDIFRDEKQRFMVLDRPVAPGFSGAPICHEDQLFGMITASSPTNSYAISIQDIEKWSQGKESLWADLGVEVEGTRIVHVDGVQENLPFGEISSINGQSVHQADDVNNILRRIEHGAAITMVVNGVEWSSTAWDRRYWGNISPETETCTWRNMRLSKVEQGWRVDGWVETGLDFPAYMMGIEHRDRLILEQSCMELQKEDKTLLVEIERAFSSDMRRYTVVLPSSVW